MQSYKNSLVSPIFLLFLCIFAPKNYIRYEKSNTICAGNPHFERLSGVTRRQMCQRDSMTFDRASHTVQYYYKLTGASDRPDAYPKDQARDALKNALKNTTQLMAYKEAGYNFRYIYYSEKNPQTTYLDILLTEKDYQ